VTTNKLFNASDPSDTLLVPLANSTPAVSPSNVTLALPVQHDMSASPDSNAGSLSRSFEKTLAEMGLTDTQYTFILQILLNGVMSDMQSAGDELESLGTSLK